MDDVIRFDKREKPNAQEGDVLRAYGGADEPEVYVAAEVNDREVVYRKAD